MVSVRRPQSLFFPFVLILVGAVAAIGLLVEGGREAWIPVPLVSVALGAWLMLLPGPRHVDVGAPAGELDACRIGLVAGGAELQLRTHDLGPDLYRASLTFRGREPRVAVDRERAMVRVEMPRPWWRSLLPQPYVERAVVTLTTRVRWNVELTGDALGGRVDLSHATLSGLSMSCGSGEVQLDLPEPRGAVLLRLSSSRVRAVLTVPDAVLVQLATDAGTWHMEVPEHQGQHAVRLGQHVLTTGDRPDSLDRFDVVLEGAGHVRVERR